MMDLEAFTRPYLSLFANGFNLNLSARQTYLQMCPNAIHAIPGSNFWPRINISFTSTQGMSCCSSMKWSLIILPNFSEQYRPFFTAIFRHLSPSCNPSLSQRLGMETIHPRFVTSHFQFSLKSTSNL